MLVLTVPWEQVGLQLPLPFQGWCSERLGASTSITIFTVTHFNPKGRKSSRRIESIHFAQWAKGVQVKRGVASFLNFIAIFGSLGPRVTTRNNMRCRRQKVLLTAVCCCFWDLPISWETSNIISSKVNKESHWYCRRYLDPLQNWKQNAYYIYSIIVVCVYIYIALIDHIYASRKKEGFKRHQKTIQIIQSVSLDLDALGRFPMVFPLLEPRFYRNLRNIPEIHRGFGSSKFNI